MSPRPQWRGLYLFNRLRFLDYARNDKSKLGFLNFAQNDRSKNDVIILKLRNNIMERNRDDYGEYKQSAYNCKILFDMLIGFE